MAFVNASTLILVGNVESRLVGPVPGQRLDRELNPRGGGAEASGVDPAGARVYHPVTRIFLTGALRLVRRVLREEGYRYRVRDLRSSARGELQFQLRGPELRDYQREVVDRAVREGHGMIDVGTGGGKTLLAAAVVARLGLPTLWIVTTRTLLAQTVRSVRELLGVEPGVVAGGRSRVAPLTVALVQSLEAGAVDLSRFRGGTLVFDEGHHAAAESWQHVVRRVGPRCHYYLSAVPFRSGDDQVVLDALAGRRLTGGRFSARFLIERGYACPIEVRVERCLIRGEMAEKPFGLRRSPEGTHFCS